MFTFRPSVTGWTRLGGALVVLALLLLPALATGLKLAPAAAAPPQVGVGVGSQNALEFVGRINQNNTNFTGFGYFTYIRDLNNSQLFTGSPSENTARFTFYATATMTSRAIVGSEVFVINSAGTMTFYFNNSPGSRNFTNPNSFRSGTPIATASMRYQDILLVQSANKGLATGVAEVTQLTATPFSLGGNTYTLGQPNLFYRFSTVGNGTRTQVDPPISFVLMAGNAVTSGVPTFLPLISRDEP